MIKGLQCVAYCSKLLGPVPLFSVIGPSATFSETSVVLGFIGLLFGVSYTFRNCKSSMTWYEGRRNKKIMRAMIVNRND